MDPGIKGYLQLELSVDGSTEFAFIDPILMPKKNKPKFEIYCCER